MASCNIPNIRIIDPSRPASETKTYFIKYDNNESETHTIKLSHNLANINSINFNFNFINKANSREKKSATSILSKVNLIKKVNDYPDIARKRTLAELSSITEDDIRTRTQIWENQIPENTLDNDSTTIDSSFYEKKFEKAISQHDDIGEYLSVDGIESFTMSDNPTHQLKRVNQETQTQIPQDNETAQLALAEQSDRITIEQLRQINDILEQRLTELKAMKQNHQKVLEHAQTELITQKHTYQAALDKLQAKLTQQALTHQEAVNELQAKLESLTVQYTNQTQQLKDTQTQLQQKESELKETQTKHTTLATQLVQKEQNLAETKAQLTTLTAQNTAQAQKLNETQTQLQQKESELKEAQTKHTTLATQLAQKEQNLAETKAQLTTLTVQKQTDQKALVKVQTELSDQKLAYQKALVQLQQANDELEKQQQDYEELENTIAKMPVLVMDEPETQEGIGKEKQLIIDAEMEQTHSEGIYLQIEKQKIQEDMQKENQAIEVAKLELVELQACRKGLETQIHEEAKAIEQAKLVLVEHAEVLLPYLTENSREIPMQTQQFDSQDIQLQLQHANENHKKIQAELTAKFEQKKKEDQLALQQANEAHQKTQAELIAQKQANQQAREEAQTKLKSLTAQIHTRQKELEQLQVEVVALKETNRETFEQRQHAIEAHKQTKKNAQIKQQQASDEHHQTQDRLTAQLQANQKALEQLQAELAEQKLTNQGTLKQQQQAIEAHEQTKRNTQIKLQQAEDTHKQTQNKLTAQLQANQKTLETLQAELVAQKATTKSRISMSENVQEVARKTLLARLNTIKEYNDTITDKKGIITGLNLAIRGKQQALLHLSSQQLLLKSNSNSEHQLMEENGTVAKSTASKLAQTQHSENDNTSTSNAMKPLAQQNNENSQPSIIRQTTKTNTASNQNDLGLNNQDTQCEQEVASEKIENKIFLNINKLYTLILANKNIVVQRTAIRTIALKRLIKELNLSIDIEKTKLTDTQAYMIVEKFENEYKNKKGITGQTVKKEINKSAQDKPIVKRDLKKSNKKPTKIILNKFGADEIRVINGRQLSNNLERLSKQEYILLKVIQNVPLSEMLGENEDENKLIKKTKGLKKYQKSV